jgi:tetratricopeptide (TPR) repeat protein
MQEPAV